MQRTIRPIRSRGSISRLPSAQCLLLLLVPLLPQAATASELRLDELARPAEAVLSLTDVPDREHLVAEFRVFTPEGASFQEIGDRSVDVARNAVEGMEALGWTLTAENWQRRGGEFDFRKEVVKNVRLRVGAAGKPVEGKMRPFVLLSYRATRRLPFEDITGCDPPDVPRYPGSVRVKWMNLLGDFSAKYLVVAPVGEVEAFFRQELPGEGWQAGNGVATLNYVKGGMTKDEAVAAQGDRAPDPMALAEGLIPSTLAVAIHDNEGIAEIGIGRAAGSGRTLDAAELTITPDRPEAAEPAPLMTTLDPERDLPAYPGLELLSRRTVPSNPPGKETILLSYVKEGAPMEEALTMADFYLEEMEDRGWALEDQEWHGIGRELEYRKDAVRTRVSIRAVGRYPLPERRSPIRIPVEVLVTLSIPGRDVAGNDIAQVPRYPGSVRFYHLKVAIDHLVRFKAVAPRGGAEWFFIDELPMSGWSFAGNDSTGLLFVPASTAGSAAQALASGQLIPDTLKVKVDDERDGTVKIGMALTEGG